MSDSVTHYVGDSCDPPHLPLSKSVRPLGVVGMADEFQAWRPVSPLLAFVPILTRTKLCYHMPPAGRGQCEELRATHYVGDPLPQPAPKEP
jgi:hypothetical protein